MTSNLIDADRWTQLTSLIHKLEVQQETRLKATHERFNVFTTLLSPSDEVRLHTRFIGKLLDPTGEHDCGDLFLKLFLETLKKSPPYDHEDAPCHEDDEKFNVTRLSNCQWSIYKEKRITPEDSDDTVQLDLILESTNGAIAIENKIYHHEGTRQLERYGKHLTSLKHDPGMMPLLFLTLDGHAASTNHDHDYLRISYREHILAWLELCLQHTYAIPRINQVIIQYKAVVQQLTGTNLEARSMEKIKNFLSKNPSIISQLPQIEEARDLLYRERMFIFLQELKEHLNEEYKVTDRAGMLPPAEENSPGLVICPIKGDFTVGFNYEIWIEQNNHDNLICGIEVSWRKSNLTEEEEAKLKAAGNYISSKCEREDYSDPNYKKSWGGTRWPLGVHVVLGSITEGKKDFSIFFDNEKKTRMIQECHHKINLCVAVLRQALNQEPQTTLA